MAAKKPQKRTTGAQDSAANSGADSGDVKAPVDMKARMRAALDAKNNRAKDVPHDVVEARQKANGPEVVGGAPKMHRRKSG